MKFENLVNETGYCISFEQVSVPSSEGINLRFIVNKAKESWHLRVHPQPDVEVTTYQIDFPFYITFLVAVDDYTLWNEDERFRGDAFRIYEKSTFLDYLEKDWKLSSAEFPEKRPILYALACLDHIVYIVSYEEPIITVVTPS